MEDVARVPQVAGHKGIAESSVADPDTFGAASFGLLDLETQQQINKLEKNFPAGNLESVKLAVPIVSDTNYVIMAPEKFFKNEVNQGL